MSARILFLPVKTRLYHHTGHATEYAKSSISNGSTYIISKTPPLIIEEANALDSARSTEVLHYRSEAGPGMYSATSRRGDTGSRDRILQDPETLPRAFYPTRPG